MWNGFLHRVITEFDTVGGAVDNSYSFVVKHLGAQNLEGISTANVVDYPGESIQGFRVSISCLMIEVSEDFIMPMCHGLHNWDKSEFHGAGDIVAPLGISPFGLWPASQLKDVEELFFEGIGVSQGRKVFCPSVQDKCLSFVEVGVMPIQKEAVVHQLPLLLCGYSFPDSHSDLINRSVRQLYNVKLIYYDLGHWQEGVGDLPIVISHIHTHKPDPVLKRESRQETRDSGLLPVLENLEHSAIHHIAEDAPIGLANLQFINAHPLWCLNNALFLYLCNVFVKDVPYCFFVDADCIGQGRESLLEGLTHDIAHQPLGHLVLFVNVWQFLKKRLLAALAFVTLLLNKDANTFTVNRGIHRQFGQFAVPIKQIAAAVRADGVLICILSSDPIVVGGFLHFESVPFS